MIHGDPVRPCRPGPGKLGARVQTAVSGSTDYLICGENVGATKIKKAERMGVAILTESQYITMVDEV